MAEKEDLSAVAELASMTKQSLRNIQTSPNTYYKAGIAGGEGS